MLVFDDGYKSNIEIAAPILEKYGFTATVAVIGVNIGRDTYAGTDIPIIPNFSYADAAAEYATGILDFQSHSYNMHCLPDSEFFTGRSGVLQIEGESAEDYTAVLSADYMLSKSELEANIGNTVNVFVYPYGLYSEESESILKSLGVLVTVTTDSGINTVKYDDGGEQLYLLKRLNVPGDTTAAELAEILK